MQYTGVILRSNQKIRCCYRRGAGKNTEKEVEEKTTRNDERKPPSGEKGAASSAGEGESKMDGEVNNADSEKKCSGVRGWGQGNKK